MSKPCLNCGKNVDGDPATCPHCGFGLVVSPPVVGVPASYANYPRGGPAPQGSPDDFTTTLIPYKNPDSLWSYYLGLFSILPLFGLPMGLIAVIKGAKALRTAKAQPETKGKGHSYVGIGCGSIGLIFNLLILGLIVAALLSHK